MLNHFFYGMNLSLVLACLLGLRLAGGERRVSLSLLQVLLLLPLLVGEYLHLSSLLEPSAITLLFFSENVAALLLFSLAWRLSRSTTSPAPEPAWVIPLQVATGLLFFALSCYCRSCQADIRFAGVDQVVAGHYGPLYYHALALLVMVLAAAWRLEIFWRSLPPVHRWEYKYLLVGAVLLCGSLGWAASYRLTYQRLVLPHLLLLAVLVFAAWLFVLYATAHHRLLNRKLFISRKVIYAFTAPTLFAAYLFVLGVALLVMRHFGFTLPFVLRWLLVAAGLVALLVFALSARLRRRLQYLISTHFYVNKYEYRDEWLALSRRLQGARDEPAVAAALLAVLRESLYTTRLVIWLGDEKTGYRPLPSTDAPEPPALEASDSLVCYLKKHHRFYREEHRRDDPEWQWLAREKESFFAGHNLVLVTTLGIGDRLVGLVGLGPEFTGGRYDHDDFDLLTALGTQTAAALLAVRMAEELAHVREQQAWERLSAFVLHDIKNAAAMLSLLRENAPRHLHEPEFQQDLLEVVDDALKRMARVEQRLKSLREEIVPVFASLELSSFLEQCRRRLAPKLAPMKIVLTGPGEKVFLASDPDLLFTIFENLLLNARQAGGSGTEVEIAVAGDEQGREVVVQVRDNGPGIAAELLPEALFAPFKSGRPGGSGIGLWQARRLVTSLGGTISAANRDDGGACFTIRLPREPVVRENALPG